MGAVACPAADRHRPCKAAPRLGQALRHRLLLHHSGVPGLWLPLSHPSVGLEQLWGLLGHLALLISEAFSVIKILQEHGFNGCIISSCMN